MNNNDSVVTDINQTNYQELKEKGVIADGMIPKLDNCFHAIKNGVRKVCIGKQEMLFNKDIKFTTVQ